jgi:signal transduction histidine kinase
VVSTHLIGQDEGALSQLRHDLRQYVAAGILLTLQPGDDQLEPALRSRLRRINQLFSRMRELTETPPAEPEAPDRTPPVDLVELVDECVSVTRLRHDVPLDVTGDGHVEATVDPVMIRRAVSNVLDNATRAAGESGQVHVGVHRLRGQAVVEVTDDGNGFGRIPSVSGHGMSIVDQALRSCHGRLEISSGPGPGTTVRMLIPAQPDASELS